MITTTPAMSVFRMCENAVAKGREGGLGSGSREEFVVGTLWRSLPLQPETEILKCKRSTGIPQPPVRLTGIDNAIKTASLCAKSEFATLWNSWSYLKPLLTACRC